MKTFDVAGMLDSEQAIAEYLSIALEGNDASALAEPLGAVARARGMTAVAEDAGLAREALYKAVRAGAQPRFETIQRVMATMTQSGPSARSGRSAR